MSVLPVHIPSIGRWSFAPFVRVLTPKVREAEPAESVAFDDAEGEEWVRQPLPMPLFVASTVAGSLAMILSGVGFLVLR
ncbi:hypothetical protein [uncultured Amnibacterium sp.]|uniref:hypothetical protein n=1 Tax=uncultured Amnibacterium sp. TaxID=1631851 RepID=UPI0035C94515